MTPEATIQARIDSIQVRRNFHPSLGARQLNARRDPDLRCDYFSLKEMMKTAERLSIEVTIPYDPTGHDPLGHRLPLASILKERADARARRAASKRRRAALR